MNPVLRTLLPTATAALPIGIVLGFVAHEIERRFSPVGLFPMTVGVVVGAASYVAGRLLGRTGRISLWISTTLAALACCGTMHYAGYRTAVRAAEADQETHRRMMQAFPQTGFLAPPPGIGSFGDFWAREWDVGRKLGPKSIRGGWLGLWWTLDALALLVAALSTALFCGERDRKPSQAIAPLSSPDATTSTSPSQSPSPGSDDHDSSETPS